MRFREDVFSKIITFITVAILLAAMLAEGFVIYQERSAKEKAREELTVSTGMIENLNGQIEELKTEKQELEVYKDNWENQVIMADNEVYQALRADLFTSHDLIPDVAIEASLLAEQEEKEALLAEEEAEEESGREDKKAEEVSEENKDEPEADFRFPDVAQKEWFLPLNMGTLSGGEYLFYARAFDLKRDKYLDLLYSIQADENHEQPMKDESCRYVWTCVGYDAGNGWQEIVQENPEP